MNTALQLRRRALEVGLYLIPVGNGTYRLSDDPEDGPMTLAEVEAYLDACDAACPTIEELVSV